MIPCDRGSVIANMARPGRESKRQAFHMRFQKHTTIFPGNLESFQQKREYETHSGAKS